MSAIISTPVNVTTPAMLANCIKICITDDEVGAGSCTAAELEITVVSTSSNLDGDTFTFLGYTFYVDNSLSGPVGNYLPWDGGSANANAIHLANALAQHPGFNGAVEITTPVGGVFTITWIECGFIEDFLPDFTGLSYAPSVTSSANGTDFQYLDGFQFIYQVYELVAGEEVALCEILPLTPIIDGSEGISCFDLKAKLPPLNPGLPIKTFTENLIPNFVREFKVKYGTVYSAYQCGVSYGAYQDSLTFKVVASLEQITWDGMEPYVFDDQAEVEDDKKILFLTNRPKSSYTCLLIPEVINIYLNLDEIYGLADGSTTYQLFYIRYIDGVPDADSTLVATWTGDGVYQVPISPTELGMVIPAGRLEYEVWIQAENSLLVPTEISERRRFIYGSDCTCKTAIYFLDDLYCWGALRYTVLSANDYQADTVEIETTQECVGSDINYALPIREGGKNLYNIQAGDVFTYRTEGLDKKESDMEWLRMFRRSPVHMIRYATFPLSFGFRKVILLPGTIRIKEKGNSIFTDFQLTNNNEDKVHEYTL